MRLPSTVREAVDVLKIYFSKIQIADKDGDLDRDPYTSVAWTNKTLSNGATGTINWVTDFGLPEIPKMVWLATAVRDSGSAGGYYYITFQAKVTTTIYSIIAVAESAVNDCIRTTHAPVAVADNGTTYYSVTASGVNTMDVWVRVVAWVKG